MRNTYSSFVFLLSTFFLLTITACSKEKAVEKMTTVNVSVTNSAGVSQSNFTVYQMEDNMYNSYGPDPFFKQQQSVTDATGTAIFTIDPIFFTNASQRTFYFFCKYSINGTSKTKTMGVTLPKGDTRNIVIALN